MENYKKYLKKFNKITRIINIDKLFHKDLYYYDNGQVEDITDIRKDNHKYTIIKLNTEVGTKNYLVFVNIKINDKFTTHQLLETCSGKVNANKSYKNLVKYINNTSNEDILIKCYEDLTYFPRKNLFTKLMGL